MIPIKLFESGLEFSRVIEVTEKSVTAFADATGDRNPIHFSDEEAQKAGFPKKIAHGQLVIAMANPLLTDHIDGIILREQKITARRPVPVGEKVLITARASASAEIVGPHHLVEWKVTFTCQGKICFLMEAKTLIPIQ